LPVCLAGQVLIQQAADIRFAMSLPRLFLVAPDEVPAGHLLACALAAAEVGDVASILVAPNTPKPTVRELQARDIAVLTTGDPQLVAADGFDGLHIEAHDQDIAAVRASLGHHAMLGVFCDVSRDLAMRAGEAGADYVAFNQVAQRSGEPIIGWWSHVFEIPCVAFSPVDASGLDKLLPQNPDFIRPDDSMWNSEDEARKIVGAIALRIGR
jgi:thiamine-phosphate pyrophosphorylase